MSLPQLTPILKSIAQARNRYVFGLQRVPDEQLSVSPGGAARSPIALADHFASFLGFVSHMVGHQAMPQGRPEVVPSTSRDEAVARVEAAFGALHETVKALTEEDLVKMVPTPWRKEVSVQEFLGTVVYVVGYAQGQLNYAQMTYGDTDPNIPPGWGSEEI